MTERRRFGRRHALVGIGATALGASVVGPRVLHELLGAEVAGPASAAPEHPIASLLAPDASVRALFGPLREGRTLFRHWRIESVHAVRAGAIPVVMSARGGHRFAVEVFRDAADGPPPIARARGLALCLVNGGDGSARTHEAAGRGVMALGRALSARRAAGAPIPRGLLTHAERMAREPDGFFDVPLA
jgi:hypothetical protein